MKAGLVGYANNQGLGVMNQDFIKHCGIEYQLVIPSSDKGTDLSLAANNHILCNKFEPSEEEILKFCDMVDTIFCIEATYSPRLFEIAKSKGKFTCFYPMWEWFDNNDPRYKSVDYFVCTSLKCYEEVKFNNRVFVPWPVDIEYFPDRKISGPAKIFIHNAGFGGMHYRKSTPEVVEAFNMLQGDFKLLIHSQIPITHYPSKTQEIIKNDSRIIFKHGNLPEKRDLYTEGDVLIAPHKCDGQFLVGEEGMACGLPVITTNAPPMNEFGNFFAKVSKFEPSGYINNNAGFYYPDVNSLAEFMRVCAENDLSETSRHNRELIEKEYSWKEIGYLHKNMVEGKGI